MAAASDPRSITAIHRLSGEKLVKMHDLDILVLHSDAVFDIFQDFLPALTHDKDTQGLFLSSNRSILLKSSSGLLSFLSSTDNVNIFQTL
jgi:hypothetical protein